MRNLDVEMKNLFIIKKIYFLGNNVDESILLANLNPIIQSDSIWKQIAQDYLYKFYLSKKELKMANPLPNQRGAETFHLPKNYLNLNY